MIYDGVPHHLFTIPKRIYFFYGWAFIICFTLYDRYNLFLLILLSLVQTLWSQRTKNYYISQGCYNVPSDRRGMELEDFHQEYEAHSGST